MDSLSETLTLEALGGCLDSHYGIPGQTVIDMRDRTSIPPVHSVTQLNTLPPPTSHNLLTLYSNNTGHSHDNTGRLTGHVPGISHEQNTCTTNTGLGPVLEISPIHDPGTTQRHDNKSRQTVQDTITSSVTHQGNVSPHKNAQKHKLNNTKIKLFNVDFI